LKLIGIDYGDKRIGIAMSDQLKMFANPVTVIQNKGTKKNLEAILEIIKSNNVNQIVIGFPLNMNGTEGERCVKTNEFIEELKTVFDGEIIKWDERLTTVSATKMLLESDMSRQKRKKVIDKIAACYILQGYLDRIRIGGN
jgi:putative Holliday junction resolvase